MAWDKGFNFRNTSAFVTDGTNETFVLGADTYPTTRNGVTFGWDANMAGGSRDRSASVDRRLAGVHQPVTGGVQNIFRVDLPATGQYNVELALGDAGNDQPYQYGQIRDTTTALLTVDDASGTHALTDAFDDTLGTGYTAAAWPGSHATSLLTFTTTILNFALDPGTATNNSTIAHIFVSQVSGQTPRDLAHTMLHQTMVAQ